MLTYGNPKTAKGESLGYLTGILHLAPADTAIAGKSVCPWATEGCKAACLNTAGRGGIFRKGESTNAIQEARKAKTVAFFTDREQFMRDLVKAVQALVRKAEREGLRPAVRLNGTSDLPWERYAVTVDGVQYRNIMAAFPRVQFYDYTKGAVRAMSQHLASWPTNYRLTLSRSEGMGDDVLIGALSTGINVAVPFAHAALPVEWKGHAVIDGDVSDLRFMDRTGVIVGLKAKGRARRDVSGFVVR